MSMKKRFCSVNGQMMGYGASGVMKDYLTDHLGSITAEIDHTQTKMHDPSPGASDLSSNSDPVDHGGLGCL
jgi:hypothetical protein